MNRGGCPVPCGITGEPWRDIRFLEEILEPIGVKLRGAKIGIGERIFKGWRKVETRPEVSFPLGLRHSRLNDKRDAVDLARRLLVPVTANPIPAYPPGLKAFRASAAQDISLWGFPLGLHRRK
jgi:hypothetical protein